MAVFSLPVVLLTSALSPKAVLLLPVVLLEERARSSVLAPGVVEMHCPWCC